MKIRKKFYYQGIELKICTILEPYLNSKDKVEVTRVVAPNGGYIPVKISRKQTLKSIICDTKILLDGFKKRGANVKNELTKKLEL